MIVPRRGPDARIVARRALRYADGGDPTIGRPPHVRAASGLAWQTREGRRVLVAPQDDTSFLAVFAPESADVAAITLDYAPDGVRVFEERAGTKALKLDLESIAAIDETRALLVGSGSHANRRRMVLLEGTTTRVIDCTALYETLAARTDFAGSELNVEGAARSGDRFFLANRGNGAPRGDLAPVSALADLGLDALLSYLDRRGPVPPIEAVRPFDLGAVAGAPLTFTDLATGPEGRLWFLAAAERSPSAYDDGEVVGCAIGVVLPRGEAVLAILHDEDGSPSRSKPEGLALASVHEDEVRAYAVVDADDPDVPSELITISVRAPS